VSTPVGKFRIVSKDENPSYSGRHGYYPPKHPKNPLGSRWMALNVGHFRTGVTIGLHGTDVPQLIGKPVSDGCIRMRNSDVELVFKLLKIGTPVIISNQ
jgi:lipoprotein-anchoring transpeptidase ErfK/SrfK